MTVAETTTKAAQAAPEVRAAQPIARLAPSRMPIVGSIAKEFDVTPDQWRVLVDQIFPNAKTVEAIGMALAYCRARNLDIFKRPVHIVPMYSSALKRTVETVWPGIAEIRTTAHRTGNYAGIDPVKWGDVFERTFTTYVDTEVPGEKRRVDTVFEFPEYAEVTVYRMVEGQRMPFTAQVFWEEAYATRGRDSDIPNEMWWKRPRGQLAKCVEAAALRMAFPEELGNTYAAEEMEGRTIDAAPAVAAPAEKPSDRLPEPPPDDEPPVGGKVVQSEPQADQATPGETEEPAGDPEKVVHPATGEALIDNRTAEDWDQYFRRLDEEMSGFETEAEFVAAWEDFGVDAAVRANEDAAIRASRLFTSHRARIDGLARAALEAAGQGVLFGGELPMPPEDDEPAPTRAQKIAGTP